MSSAQWRRAASSASQDGLDELSAGRPQRPPAFGQQPGGFVGGRPGQACLAGQQRRPRLAEQDLAEQAQPAAASSASGPGRETPTQRGSAAARAGPDPG
jgi:hypothetical protein